MGNKKVSQCYSCLGGILRQDQLQRTTKTRYANWQIKHVDAYCKHNNSLSVFDCLLGYFITSFISIGYFTLFSLSVLGYFIT